MRIAAAAAVALGLAWAGAAAAQTMADFSDPGAHFTFSHPAAWDTGTLGAQSAQAQRFVSGLADAECQVLWLDHPQSAALAPDRLQAGSATPLSPEQWFQAAQSMSLVGAGGSVQTMSVDTDTASAWPIQRASIATTEGKTVYAAIHQRPGQQVWVSCKSFDARDRAPIFNEVIRSVRFAQDATWATAIEAAKAAAAAPPPPPPPPPAEEPRRRRRGGEPD